MSELATVSAQQMMQKTAPSDLAVGIAAEHLVCANLLMMGYRAFRTDQNCPYDVAVELGCQRMVRIQVKGTRTVRKVPQRVGHMTAYMWHVRRSGKGRSRVYADGEFDLLALVAIDIGQIAYLPPSKLKNTIHIRSTAVAQSPSHGGKAGRTFEAMTFEAAIGNIYAP